MTPVPLQVVSYAKFLYPTNALVTHKTDIHGLPPQPRPSIPRALPGSRYKPTPAKSAPAGTDLGTPRALTGCRAGSHTSWARDTLWQADQNHTEAHSPRSKRGSRLGRREQTACASSTQELERSRVHTQLRGRGRGLSVRTSFHPALRDREPWPTVPLRPQKHCSPGASPGFQLRLGLARALGSWSVRAVLCTQGLTQGTRWSITPTSWTTHNGPVASTSGSSSSHLTWYGGHRRRPSPHASGCSGAG